jgi:hypothetical protein
MEFCFPAPLADRLAQHGGTSSAYRSDIGDLGDPPPRRMRRHRAVNLAAERLVLKRSDNVTWTDAAVEAARIAHLVTNGMPIVVQGHHMEVRQHQLAAGLPINDERAQRAGDDLPTRTNRDPAYQRIVSSNVRRRRDLLDRTTRHKGLEPALNHVRRKPLDLFRDSLIRRSVSLLLNEHADREPIRGSPPDLLQTNIDTSHARPRKELVLHPLLHKPQLRRNLHSHLRPRQREDPIQHR